MNSEPLRGRLAVVVGASSGIGAAVTRALAREGGHVTLAARRQDELLEVQATLDHRGGEVRSLISTTDVTVREQVKTLVARGEEELGPVEILVNCAGICTTPWCYSQSAQHFGLGFRVLLTAGTQQGCVEWMVAS